MPSSTDLLMNEGNMNTMTKESSLRMSIKVDTCGPLDVLVARRGYFAIILRRIRMEPSFFSWDQYGRSGNLLLISSNLLFPNERPSGLFPLADFDEFRPAFAEERTSRAID